MLARMSKKALALLMVFCMVVSALSVGALAAVDTPNGEWDYEFGDRSQESDVIRSSHHAFSSFF